MCEKQMFCFVFLRKVKNMREWDSQLMGYRNEVKCLQAYLRRGLHFIVEPQLSDSQFGFTYVFYLFSPILRHKDISVK